MGSLAGVGVFMRPSGGLLLPTERRQELCTMLTQQPELIDWVLPRLRKNVGKPSRKPEVGAGGGLQLVPGFLRDPARW
jgi:hypothetical protein